ncbi:MAG TPA: hypothetical protein DER60_00560 [Syntrophomonas sp.]|jgi:hypothetical protein|nr:hypothetical protein [Syntrophomonas sp.]
MDEKRLQEIKIAKQKIVEGSLTIWNARLDALMEEGYSRDIIDHISAVDICGCGGGSPICGCDCPAPFTTCSNVPNLDHTINEMNKSIIELAQEMKTIREKINK